MDKYLQIDHLELSEDPSFIQWAKGSQTKNEHDWDDWLRLHPDKSEMVSKARSLVLAMKFVEDNPSAGTQDKVWANIKDDITKTESTADESKQSRRGIIRLLPYAAVAAVALLFLYINMGTVYDTTISTPYAKIENITLPDGSKVMVNADSKLEYDVKTWGKNREVSLKGEAFFDVQKGSKFIVKTSSGNVQVLGTSFNVYARGDEIKVQCETGKVAVTSGGKETILMPRQSVVATGKTHQFDENVTETERRGNWKRGVFVYKGAPLSDVIAELERQLDVKISIDKSQSKVQYSGSFNKSDVKTALTEVFYPLELKFDVNGKNVVIHK